jgi:hypothetical protein
MRSKGLFIEFESTETFKDRFRDDLERTLHGFVDAQLTVASFNTGNESEVSLSDKALAILSITAKSSNLQFIKMRMAVGVQIWSGRIVFTQGSDPKEVVGWSSAIQELLTLGFCRDLNGKDQIFELSQDGLNYLEKGLRDRFRRICCGYCQKVL